MKVGVFGGTFDPVHLGHLILAADALEQMELDQVLWVLTPDPPHKKTRHILPWQHRLEMLEFALEGNQKFLLSRVDIDREPPHYASDTIRILKEQSPGNLYYYLMGSDSLNDLNEWHNPEELIQLCEGIVVMIRHDEEKFAKVVTQLYPELLNKIHILKTPVIEISATDIRNRAVSGRHYRYFLPDKVYRYILENNIYQTYYSDEINELNA